MLRQTFSQQKVRNETPSLGYFFHTKKLETSIDFIHFLSNCLHVEEQDLTIFKEQVDAFFLVVMGCIVFLMQAGFAFLEAGSVR